MSFGSSGSGEGQFVSISFIKVDGEGYLYIVDENLERIQIFNPSGKLAKKYENCLIYDLAIDNGNNFCYFKLVSNDGGNKTTGINLLNFRKPSFNRVININIENNGGEILGIDKTNNILYFKLVHNNYTTQKYYKVNLNSEKITEISIPESNGIIGPGLGLETKDEIVADNGKYYCIEGDFTLAPKGVFKVRSTNEPAPSGKKRKK